MQQYNRVNKTTMTKEINHNMDYSQPVASA